MKTTEQTHDADVEDADETSVLASTLLAIAAPGATGRWFVTYALAFATVLWGEVARGGFFRFDLIVFTALAVAAGVSVRGGGSASRAVLSVSAVKNRQFGDVGYALAPVAAAVSLGVVGVASARTSRRFVMKRIVVDVAVYTSVIGVVGVNYHLPRWAELQAEGWRASANLGYANAAGLFLLIGALAACMCAASSGAVTDVIRCWLVLVGLLATQSRGAVVAVAICLVVLGLFRRDAAWILFKATAFALVTFVAFIPSVVNVTPAPVIAFVGIVACLALVIASAHDLPPALNRAIAVGLGVVATVIVVILLNTRVADSGSDQGRLRLWQEAVSRLHITGLFGAGPHQLASFSRGVVTQLFDHNDVLQYGEYYGVGGVIAVGMMAWFVSASLLAARRRIGSAEFAHGLALVLSVAFAALVDFPLQIPVIPVVSAFVFGACVGQDERALPTRTAFRAASRARSTESKGSDDD